MLNGFSQKLSDAQANAQFQGFSQDDSTRLVILVNGDTVYVEYGVGSMMMASVIDRFDPFQVLGDCCTERVQDFLDCAITRESAL